MDEVESKNHTPKAPAAAKQMVVPQQDIDAAFAQGWNACLTTINGLDPSMADTFPKVPMLPVINPVSISSTLSSGLGASQQAPTRRMFPLRYNVKHRLASICLQC